MSFHLLNIARFPGLVEEGLLGAVEPQIDKEAFAGNCFDPVVLVNIGRRLRREKEVK